MSMMQVARRSVVRDAHRWLRASQQVRFQSSDSDPMLEAFSRDKVVSVEDAVSLIRDHDTVCVSGFVTQGISEAVLKQIGKRFDESQSPRDLTLVFYGCGDPGGKRGTNHFHRPGMLRRVIASHYGQSPDIQPLIFSNKIQAHSLPMGSIARMIRAKASGSPGHFTKVGLGTFIDPRHGGGKVNEVTSESLVELTTIDGQEYLRYKPVPINVAIIRATTADPDGNLTIERESLSCDINVIATSARASGGIVIAQVERLAARGSLRMRDIKVPGPLVDCVVVAPPEDHPMGFYMNYNPYWSGEIRENLKRLQTMPLNIRKLIARRAAMELSPDDIVNLGIGMPEGVANVAAEEEILSNITLTTEAGMIGGIGASGLNFGPATSANAMLDINQQFDFYNGGGLNVTFLGAAEVDEEGNINVHKLSENSITGPGGFIDISQSTHRVCFLGTFTKKGLKTEVGKDEEGKPILKIVQEGSIPMFKKSVKQVTFNGKLANKHAQNVVYITERAVFLLTPAGLQLVEVAPGIDIDKDILAHMEFTPIIDRDNLKTMDYRIFETARMEMTADFFEAGAKFHSRFHFDREMNTIYIDLSGIVLDNMEALHRFERGARRVLDKITDHGKIKTHAVATYARSDINPDLLPSLAQILQGIDKDYFLSIRRLGGKVFFREKVSRSMNLYTNDMVWDVFTGGDPNKVLSRTEIKEKIQEFYQIKLNESDLVKILGELEMISSEEINPVLDKLSECIRHKFTST